MSSGGMKPWPGVVLLGAKLGSGADGLSVCKGSVCDDAIPSPEDACLVEDDVHDSPSDEVACP